MKADGRSRRSTLVRALGGFVLALSALAGTLAPAAATPALWMARDADSTVYLFGTFHVLRSGVGWEHEETMNAFLESDDLWLEVDLTTAGGGAGVMSLGTRPERPLSAALDPADLARVKEAAAELDIPFATLEPMRPWLASVMIARKALQRAGYVSTGPDAVFARLATRTGKPVRGFETSAGQFALFAGLSPEAELSVLRASVDEASRSSDYFDTVAAAWVSGDTHTLETRALDEIRQMGPEVYDTLVTRRNASMADTIKAVMDGGAGTHFVAVGAAHLIGPDSVQRFLADAGVPSTRVGASGDATGPIAP
ncbi:TraB/GumN family protein [Chthonobacter rhizosphaerae]|uniref:TraB/GumN family protein n=1 Tax=Chthonobacter rhizosphaerae TaxID=2735553 RepID=UPI0015EEB470|nr:TraB/GumN family protein [Chthonobacter rhizosphaerae]